MPSLDSCINDIYEPGNIPADPGVPPHIPAIVDIFFSDFAGRGSLRVDTLAPTTYNAAATLAGSGSLRAVALDQVLVTYQAAAQDSSNSATYTYTSQAIGTATANRWVLVGVITSNQSVNVSSMTVGGISATFVGRTTVGVCRAEIWKAAVPTGTTATIVVTQAGAGDRSAIGVATTSGPVTLIDSDGGNVSRLANASTVTLDTVAGGFVFAIGIHHNAAGGETLSARGMTLQNESFIEAVSIRVAVATAVTTGSSTSGLGFDLNGGTNDNFDSPYIVAAFGP